MIRVALVATLVVMLAAPGAYGQSDALRLREVDDDGGRRDLSADRFIVDVNSTLHVDIDKSVVRQRLIDRFQLEGFPPGHVERLRQLQRWAAAGQRAIPDVQRALEDLARSEKTDADFAAFEEAMDAATSAAEEILEEALQSPLGPRLDRRLAEEGLSTTEQYRVVFEEAARYAEEVTRDLDQVIQNESLYVVLGAWIRTRAGLSPQHLPGFDTYPQGEFYRVPRWNVVPTEQQREQFATLQGVARQLDAGETRLRDVLLASAESSFAVLLEDVEECVADVEADLDAVEAAAGNLAEGVRQQLTELADQVRGYLRMLTGIAERYRAGIGATDASSVMDVVLTDLTRIETETTRLVERFRMLGDEATGLPATVRTGGAAVVASAARLAGTLQGCASALEARAMEMVDLVGSSFGIARAAGQINTEALEFTDKVIEHDIGTLPTETHLDLQHTGRREPGDAITFRLGAGRVDPQTRITQEPIEDLQVLRLQMYHVLPHLETAVGLVFADPQGAAAVQKRFQAAPAYSVLFKWGSRTRVWYNSLLAFGFGANVAALDFNKDDTLEFGIAAVASAVRDYLQAGYGYNVNEDMAYWFFGVRLPMPSLPFPGGSSTEPRQIE